jgi:alcohol dehydrogenase (cytochrome c)
LTKDGTRFCPGSQGGVEWNGPAYDPKTNLAITGAADWCTTVWLSDQPPSKGSKGMPWTGGRAQNMFGKQDPAEKWGGWITATDADTGVVKWKVRTPAPALSGITPTAAGLTFAGDMAGNFYVLDTATGKELAKQKMGGALGGGIVSYTAGGAQRLAVITGTYSPIWPVPKGMSKIVVMGLRK